jgi:HEPN domain-containing protein
MPSPDLASLLMQKAAQDEYAMSRLIADPIAPDEVIGFHAQQAVEKLLKALLSHLQVAFRRTHDLTELLDLLAARGVTVPPSILDVRRLGPYAVELRYEEIEAEAEEPFDRRWAAQCVEQVRTWVESLLA